MYAWLRLATADATNRTEYVGSSTSFDLVQKPGPGAPLILARNGGCKAVTMHPLEARVGCFCPTLSVIGSPIATIADALKVTISLIGYSTYVIHYWGGRLQESRRRSTYSSLLPHLFWFGAKPFCISML